MLHYPPIDPSPSCRFGLGACHVSKSLTLLLLKWQSNRLLPLLRLRRSALRRPPLLHGFRESLAAGFAQSTLFLRPPLGWTPSTLGRRCHFGESRQDSLDCRLLRLKSSDYVLYVIQSVTLLGLKLLPNHIAI